MLALVSVAAAAAPAYAHTATTAASIRDLAEQLRQVRSQQAKTRAELDELQALQADLLESTAGAEVESGPTVSLYGFYEAGLQRTWARDENPLAGLLTTRETTFLLGDLHVYLDVAPSPGWRGLVEARVTAVNGGPNQFESGEETVNTTIVPVNRPQVGQGGSLVAVALTLERGYIEYVFRDAVGVRIGLWLTPWGIWNVDHGSPTLIPLLEPYFQTYQGFPTHQTGLAVFGKVHALPWTLEYHFGLSNGRIAGPVMLRTSWPSFDLSDNKMLSARLTAHRNGDYRLRLGLSGYWGRSATAARTLVGVAPLEVESNVDFELDEWGLGADVAYDDDHLRIRFEFSYTQFRYLRGRPRATLFPLEASADSAQFGGYVLLSSPFDWLGIRIEPYVYAELLWWPSSVAPRDGLLTPSVGVNLDFTTQLRLKFQYGWYRFYRYDGGKLDFGSDTELDLHTAAARLVVSF